MTWQIEWLPSAADVYQRRLLNESRGLQLAVEHTLNLLERHADFASARHVQLRLESGAVLWRISIRPDSEDWSLVWAIHPSNPQTVAIYYLGPANYGA